MDLARTRLQNSRKIQIQQTQQCQDASWKFESHNIDFRKQKRLLNRGLM